MQDARKVSLKSASWFDRIYKFLACAAFLLAAEPLVYTFTRPTLGGWAWAAASAVPVALFALGYALQSLFGAVTGVRRAGSQRAYENISQYFKPAEAALPIAAAAGLGVLSATAVSDWMKTHQTVRTGVLYDKWSAIPLFAGVLCAAFVIFGVVVWFYPYSRIISPRSLPLFLGVSVVDFAINLTFKQPQDFLVACSALFLLFAAVVINQSHIVEVMNAAGTGIITPRVRFYNLVAVGIFCALTVLAAPFVLTVLVGLAVLAKMILFFILRGILGQTEEQQYADAEVLASDFSSGVFGGIGDLGGEAAAKSFFAVFAILSIAVILFFIIIRRINLFKVIYDFMNSLFANLMDFLANIFEFNKFSTEKFALSDYRDVETKTDKSAIRGFDGARAQPPRSYRDFKRRLDAFADARARFGFAYAELVRCWGEGNIRLSTSDTPAEILLKLKTAASNPDAEPITRAFETVKYAERDLTPSDSDRLVNAMCKQIRRAYGEAG